jgi:hypothetical protein
MTGCKLANIWKKDVTTTPPDGIIDLIKHVIIKVFTSIDLWHISLEILSKHKFNCVACKSMTVIESKTYQITNTDLIENG